MSAEDDLFTETAAAHGSSSPVPGYALPLELERRDEAGTSRGLVGAGGVFPLQLALKLIACGPRRSADPIEWTKVAQEMTAYCVGMEDVTEAAARIIADALPSRGSLPPVLDACCSTRSFWFDKADARALFMDRRNEECPIKPDAGHPARNLIVAPDVVADFTDMPFPSGVFTLVVFDPPHFVSLRETSVMAKTYGTLFGTDWKEMLLIGFRECFRVLRPEGILVFKWCEAEIPVGEVLALTPEKPLFGHISGRRAQTHWITFLKGGGGVELAGTRAAEEPKAHNIVVGDSPKI